MRALWEIAILLAFAVFQVRSHVALTYPPARRYALDFLDTQRTVGPCGIPKNSSGSAPTIIANDGPIEITWHLGYPHKGGYKITLLDPDERELVDLTQGYQGAQNKYAQKAIVTLPPNLECPKCVLKLERQALEWGPRYKFKSCADVTIVKQQDYREDCMGNGQSGGGGRCSCRRTFYGQRCQYQNECADDGDCSNRGRCIDTLGTALPLKQCFCQSGSFGSNCERRVAPKTDDVADDSLSRNQFNGQAWKQRYVRAKGMDNAKVEFYSRVVDGGRTLEGVLVGKNVRSYLAVGWRPRDSTKSCQSFPFDISAPKGGDRDFHPMDCVDYVVATVDDTGLVRIGDYYSRDRSTPQPDAFYGGEDDILDSLGWVEDGDTYVAFKKRAAGVHGSDHSFAGDLHVVLAHGRSDDPFYGSKELKYHGPNRWKGVSSSAARTGATMTGILVLMAALAKFI